MYYSTSVIRLLIFAVYCMNTKQQILPIFLTVKDIYLCISSQLIDRDMCCLYRCCKNMLAFSLKNDEKRRFLFKFIDLHGRVSTKYHYSDAYGHIYTREIIPVIKMLTNNNIIKYLNKHAIIDICCDEFVFRSYSLCLLKKIKKSSIFLSRRTRPIHIDLGTFLCVCNNINFDFYNICLMLDLHYDAINDLDGSTDFHNALIEHKIFIKHPKLLIFIIIACTWYNYPDDYYFIEKLFDSIYFSYKYFESDERPLVSYTSLLELPLFSVYKNHPFEYDDIYNKFKHLENFTFGNLFSLSGFRDKIKIFENLEQIKRTCFDKCLSTYKTSKFHDRYAKHVSEKQNAYEEKIKLNPTLEKNKIFNDIIWFDDQMINLWLETGHFD